MIVSPAWRKLPTVWFSQEKALALCPECFRAGSFWKLHAFLHFRCQSLSDHRLAWIFAVTSPKDPSPHPISQNVSKVVIQLWNLRLHSGKCFPRLLEGVKSACFTCRASGLACASQSGLIYTSLCYEEVLPSPSYSPSSTPQLCSHISAQFPKPPFNRLTSNSPQLWFHLIGVVLSLPLSPRWAHWGQGALVSFFLLPSQNF